MLWSIIFDSLTNGRLSPSLHTPGKYGDGSDVTTWKINFRCALNGLKDIIERRDLEEPDCRVYQMLPCSSTGRQRGGEDTLRGIFVIYKMYLLVACPSKI